MTKNMESQGTERAYLTKQAIHREQYAKWTKTQISHIDQEQDKDVPFNTLLFNVVFEIFTRTTRSIPLW